MMDKKSDYIIAIGSSAGGLTPLKAFFDYTPSDDVSYVLLSHLSMNHKSELKEILKRHSSIQLVEASDEMEIKRNIVYLLPSNKLMVVEDGKLCLKDRIDAPLYPNWAINIFLESLAAYKKDKTIAVVLSGSGSDGSLGAEAIKKAGGMVIAQDPASCDHSSMPLNVINKELADFVLLPEEMPAVIQEYIDAKLAIQ